MTCSVVYGTGYKLCVTAVKGNMLPDIDTTGSITFPESRDKILLLSAFRFYSANLHQNT